MSATTGLTHRGVRKPFWVGNRTILAMTCWTCGHLRPGSRFRRRTCTDGRGGTRHYIDRRCLDGCNWRHAENSLGRNGEYRG